MQQNYVNAKREGFRTRIRREEIESKFTKKRRTCNAVELEFPHQCLEDIIRGIDVERNLIQINNYLTQEEKRFLQSDQFLQLIPYALDHLSEENWSKFVVNLTFFMNGEQILCLINLGGMNNLVKLLESDSMEDKDTYAVIITNILCELPEQSCTEFNKRYHCIEEICNSYATYGSSDELNEKYLGIIIYILRNTTIIGDLDKLCEVADNIAVNTLNSKIKILSYRVLQYIFESNQQLFELFERLNCIDQLTESNSGLQLLITLLQCNPMIMKQLIQKQLLLKKYTEILLNCNDYKMLKYTYIALREIFSDDFDYEIEQQGLLLDALNKNIKNQLNQNIAIPNAICLLFSELVNSQHSHQVIMNMPIIQIVNTKLRDLDHSPIEYIDYLRMMKIIIEEGETIYPDYYVGQFIQFQGEQILCMIQNSGDDQCYSLAQELLTYFE